MGDTTSVAVVARAFIGSGGSTGGGDIFFEGALMPGASPGKVVFENDVAFGPTATVALEIGGLTAGSEFDQLITLNVVLIDPTGGWNIFNPQLGDSFDLFDFNINQLSGSFATTNLPALDPGLQWDSTQLLVTGVLAVVPESSAFLMVGSVFGFGIAVSWAQRRLRRKRPRPSTIRT